ncbi:hypothetical protein PC114_g18832 [Phytophthora cactorum]|nr:hypothetical protein PC114_g18832 [Phytophthora cactorum]KAG3011826.1 hypothetical protein PC120_g14233 [Phytophthora cactorum]
MQQCCESVPPVQTKHQTKEFPLRDGNSQHASAQHSSLRPRDPFEAKLVRTLHEVFAAKEAGQRVPTEMVTKERKNVFWRQFVISKAAMLTGHR